MPFFLPIVVVVICNTFYQICAKSMPEQIDPFASLTITYAVSAIFSGILYFVFNKDVHLLQEYSKINWAPFVLGLVIVGLEAGFIYAYKVGWPVSTASIVQSSFLSIVLFLVGILLYHETISLHKVIGMLICMVGLIFLNK